MELKDHHKANLRKLADYLLSGKLVKEFDMWTYCKKTDTFGCTIVISEVQQHECGTVGCAIGHGPAAGIKIPDGCYGWSKYAERMFGMDSSEYMEEAFTYMFASSWKWYDNTPEGAARRILAFLDNNCVPPANWREERGELQA